MTTHSLKFIPYGKTAYDFGSAGAQLQQIRGLSGNPVKTLTVPVYGEDGEIYVGTQQEPRILSVDWIIKNSISQQRLTIAEKLNPNLGLGLLVYENDLAKYRLPAVVSLKPEDGDLVYNQAYLRYNVVFTAPDPDWLSYEPTTIKMEDFIGGLGFPLEFPISFAERGDGATINYTGHNPAPVIIDLRGDEAVNPVIENTTTGYSIETQNLTLSVGEKLIINTDPKNLSVQFDDGTGTLTDAWNKIAFGSEFWQLINGTNEIAFSATSGTPECYLTYDQRYAGV